MPTPTDENHRATIRNALAPSAPLRYASGLGGRESSMTRFEVLQGFRHDRDWQAAHDLLMGFHYRDMVGQGIALQAARNYRILKTRGITVRKTIDVLIGTYCIVNDLQLLHADRDFEAIEMHLGLRVVSPEI